MTVRRIVANLQDASPGELAEFYENLFGLERLMDQGWIVTSGGGVQTPVQISFASEGGSGTPVPALSIEVDDLDACFDRAKALGCRIAYGPTQEPWGARRFFIEDPAGRLVNILTHALPGEAGSSS